MTRPNHSIIINGSVSAGFESLKALFEKEMHEKAEDAAQLCIYHQGRKVVDLWASVNNDESFGSNSLMTVFSSGKAIECLAIAYLVDRGLLTYDDKIADHWPEFGQYGKENTSIADLMRHEAGLQTLSEMLQPEDLWPENLSKNTVGRIIENQQISLPQNPMHRRKYHALSHGWVVNELFRRVDPKGRTLGQYLREEISTPLAADIYVGLRDEELARKRPLKTHSFSMQFFEGLKPAKFRKKVACSTYDMLEMMLEVMRSLLKKRRLKKRKSMDTTQNRGDATKPIITAAKTPIAGMIKDPKQMFSFCDRAEVVKGESSSFAANCSASGIAKVAGMMAMGGRLEGREYFGAQSWKALHAEPTLKPMGVGDGTNFTQGGLNLFTMAGKRATKTNKRQSAGREGFYGWRGTGGSIFEWHPELKLGFGFVPNSMHIFDTFNERGKIYQVEAIRCVERLHEQALKGKKNKEINSTLIEE